MPQTSMKPAEGSGPASRLSTLPPGEPKLTLGWEAWRWCEKLTQPNGPRAGQPFEPTVDQLRFLLWWYAIDREGRWLFNHGARRLAKGSGKSPFAAVLALIEFCAPVRLARFDSRAPGGCWGKPVDMPLVQIAATAESQTANTMRMVRAFAPKGSAIVREYNMDPGKTKYYKLPEGTLEVILPRQPQPKALRRLSSSETRRSTGSHRTAAWSWQRSSLTTWPSRATGCSRPRTPGCPGGNGSGSHLRRLARARGRPDPRRDAHPIRCPHSSAGH
jgi:hypothetical protein